MNQFYWPWDNLCSNYQWLLPFPLCGSQWTTVYTPPPPPPPPSSTHTHQHKLRNSSNLVWQHVLHHKYFTHHPCHTAPLSAIAILSHVSLVFVVPVEKYLHQTSWTLSYWLSIQQRRFHSRTSMMSTHMQEWASTISLVRYVRCSKSLLLIYTFCMCAHDNVCCSYPAAVTARTKCSLTGLQEIENNYIILWSYSVLKWQQLSAACT